MKNDTFQKTRKYHSFVMVVTKFVFFFLLFCWIWNEGSAEHLKSTKKSVLNELTVRFVDLICLDHRFQARTLKGTTFDQ